MDKTIKLSVEDSKVKLVDAVCSNLKSLFSGCRVNFLLGAGFSANLLGTLGNNEIIFEAIQKYRTANATEEDKLKVLTAHLYWSFFKKCIERWLKYIQSVLVNSRIRQDFLIAGLF